MPENPIADFHFALAQAGLPCEINILADGKLHRFRTPPDKEDNSWYVLHQTGDFFAGAFGCWKRNLKQTWCSRNRDSFSPQEWREVSAKWKESETARAADEKKLRDSVRSKCSAMFAHAPGDPSGILHPYLDSKSIAATAGVMLSTMDAYPGWLAIPLRDAAGVLHTCQMIGDDGTKLYLYGGRTQGCFHAVGNPESIGGPIVICEGYATAVSIFSATGWATLAAMCCGNLHAVAGEIRKLYPGRSIIIAADNDQFTEGNPGLVKARAAAKAINASVACPDFGDEALLNKPTDFNDLFCLAGKSEVLRQILCALPLVATPVGLFKLPPPDDPTELLKYRFLSQRGSLLFCGPSGVGKSSWVMQAYALWANGLPYFDIQPRRPLKCLMIQAENDDGDIAQIRDGIARGLQFGEAQRKQFFENVLVAPHCGVTGRQFCQEIIRPLLDIHAPDLVAIDPMLSYIGGDVKEQKVVGEFLRVYLHPELHTHNCAAVLCHHTNKPPSGKEKAEWRNGEFAYLGSGSAEWANYPRAVLAMQATGVSGLYRLHAGKRGSRLAWTDPNSEDDEIAYSKLIAWSRDKDTICWRVPSEEELPPELQGYGHGQSNGSCSGAVRSGNSAGRKSVVSQILTMNSHDFLAACLPAGEGLNEIARRLESWLAAKNVDVSEKTCKRVIPAMVEAQKLSKSPVTGLYSKGPNA